LPYFFVKLFLKEISEDSLKMNVKYVIPSFQRPSQLQEKTLKYLADHEVSKEDIHIFLRKDDPHLEEYLKLKDYTFHVIEEKGIGKTHNRITQHFDEGEFLCELDDDLEDIIDNERKPILFFKDLCYKMFNVMLHMGVSYGGTYSVPNPMFMTNTAEFTTDLRYMLGCVRWRFVRKSIQVETDYAEDMENCILHYIRDKRILKNNWVAPITKNYSEGGCDGSGRNQETEKEAKQYLAVMYPQYAKLFQRKNGIWDCKIKHYRK
jgi:hypothetical protein